MISFIISLVALLGGYFIYGRYVERIFGPDDRQTPAVAMADGVDYIKLPNWKVFMIQFLNIAGTGPIFGAIMGAWYGPWAYLWIVLGCIFAGSVHDYFMGMLSVRHGGASLPEIIREYLGNNAKRVLLVFTCFLLIMVGVVFVYSPALILGDMFPKTSMFSGVLLWIIVIFLYYVLATLMPIDKIIGKFYPIFAFALLFMAAALMICLFIKMPALPELWSNLQDSNLNNPKSILGTDTFIQKNPLFPALFLTIACGAISGFHATQSPLMARCIGSEKMGRKIFYGSMITEGVVALIWATVSAYFFYYGGWREVCDPVVVNNFLEQSGKPEGKSLVQYFTAPQVVEIICSGWLGTFGAIIAILGVVAAPITSGDTALRSARLIIAEALGMEQRTIVKRLLIAIPMFIASILLLVWQIENPNGFNTIWQYFGWANQTLSVFSLWTITIYLTQRKKPFIITLIPALFMTMICSTFLFVSQQAFGMDYRLGVCLGVLLVVVALVLFLVKFRSLYGSAK